MNSSKPKVGGVRAGAGRKPSNGYETQVKRIPTPLVPVVDGMIEQLKTGQIITKSDNIPLDAMLPSPVPVRFSVPLAEEKIPAGFPSPAEPYATDYLDFNEYLISNPAATITVRCGGYSMIDAGINKDDLLVIDRSIQPSHRDIVMADLGNEYTIKRLHMLSAGRIELHSENTSEEYPNFTFKEGEHVSIVGVVVYTIKNMRK